MYIDTEQVKSLVYRAKDIILTRRSLIRLKKKDAPIL